MWPFNWNRSSKRFSSGCNTFPTYRPVSNCRRKKNREFFRFLELEAQGFSTKAKFVRHLSVRLRKSFSTMFSAKIPESIEHHRMKEIVRVLPTRPQQPQDFSTPQFVTSLIIKQLSPKPSSTRYTTLRPAALHTRSPTRAQPKVSCLRLTLCAFRARRKR